MGWGGTLTFNSDGVVHANGGAGRGAAGLLAARSNVGGKTLNAGGEPGGADGRRHCAFRVCGKYL